MVQSVIIYSEWETPAALEASDQQRTACDENLFPQDPGIGECRPRLWARDKCWAKAREVAARQVSFPLTQVERESHNGSNGSNLPHAEERRGIRPWHYFDVHIQLAKKLPGLRKYEISYGPVAVLAGSPDVYLIGTLHFDDLAAIKKAFASPEGQAAAADRQVYAPDNTGVQMFLFDDREV